MTITADDPSEIEEERRLCYVGITRAMENLTLTCARRRMMRGEVQYNKMSRFLKEIPVHLFATGGNAVQKETQESTQNVYLQAMQEGIMDIFMEAGAIVMNANCSVCWGSCQGVIGEGETLISTGTRNFKGRAGHKDSFVYLASAATVAASAVKGEIITADRLEA
jgi:hypothetical protein